MARLGATLGILLLLSAEVACDTAGEHEGCADGTDLSACPRSAFTAQDSRAREVFGFLRRGEDGVLGALVRVEGRGFTGSASTELGGFYRVYGAVPALYDLTFVMPGGVGGRNDILVFRDVGYRYFEPQLDVPVRTLPRSWTAHVQVRLDAPLAEGHTLLFLAGGDGVYGASGDLEKGVDVYTARYEQKANLRAVEYDAAKGPISASAYGKLDIVTDAGTPSAVTLHLDPIEKTATPQFTLEAPPGFVPGPVEIRIASSRTSDGVLASIPWGETVSIPIVPDQNITYRLRAERADGAISDSGEQGFDPSKPTAISLPEPPAATDAGDRLVVSGTGIMEHVLEPKAAGGPGVRIVMTQGETALPDLRALAIENGAGEYTWTVRRFSTMKIVENIFGADTRRYRPAAISAPRTLLLR